MDNGILFWFTFIIGLLSAFSLYISFKRFKIEQSVDDFNKNIRNEIFRHESKISTKEIVIVDDNMMPRIKLGTMSMGSFGICIFDKNGETRGAIGMSPDSESNNPFIELFDNSGIARLAASLTPSNDSAFLLLNERGSVVAQLGNFIENGTSIWLRNDDKSRLVEMSIMENSICRIAFSGAEQKLLQVIGVDALESSYFCVNGKDGKPLYLLKVNPDAVESNIIYEIDGSIKWKAF
jgi:hypothetical protein